MRECVLLTLVILFLPLALAQAGETGGRKSAAV
jgi:hypothetical protein